MRVKSIELCFENVTSVKFPAACIRTFSIRGISESVNMVSRDKTVKVFSVCQDFVLCLEASANNKKYYQQEDWPGKKGVFERLKIYPDITSAIVEMDDGSKTEYWVPFKGNDLNSLQKTKSTEDGGLRIAIRDKALSA